MKPRPLSVCAAVALALLLSHGARADLTDMKVYTPLVEKGDLQFELIGNVVIDDRERHKGFKHQEFELEYGVNDFWATSITASVIEPAGAGLKYDILGWENTFQLTDEGEYWLDLGLHLEVELNDEDDEPHNLEARWLFRRASGPFEHVLNLNFEQQFGSAADEGVELEYIWRSKYALSATSAIGFEAFGALGELKDVPALAMQEHRLGPAFYRLLSLGELTVELNLIWLFGLTASSATHTPHWQIEIDF